jgi:hypothetical protein
MTSLIMSATANVQHGSTGAVTVSRRLAKAIPEFGRVQELLLSGKELNPRIFTDFRDALNHVSEYRLVRPPIHCTQTAEQDASCVLSVLAERVRVAYQLCQARQADLKNNYIKFQTGSFSGCVESMKAAMYKAALFYVAG